jgi:glycosyltransferase involved in cell wall biosynthesis
MIALPPSLVSILIPCYNTERWIAQAIDSALAQTWPNKDVIVVDDGSTDDSLKAIRSFGDRIRWETGPNRGGSAARNRLLEMAAGEWIQYLDADDYLLPEKIASQMAGSGKREAESGARGNGSELRLDDVDVLYAPVILEHWEADRVSHREELPIPEPHDPWLLLARWFLPQTSAGLWRKSAVVEVGGWKQDQPCCQEHELYLRLLQAGKRFAFCPHAGAVYRQWSEGTVCKKDPLLSVVKRLEVVDGVETHLQAVGQLTPPRRDAVAHARLECARGIYRLDRRRSIACAARAVSQHPGFRLPPAVCFPWTYRAVFRLAGFDAAERIAGRVRKWRTAKQNGR